MSAGTDGFMGRPCASPLWIASGTIGCYCRYVTEGIPDMADDPAKHETPSETSARLLVKETGITDAQAVGLVALLGAFNWTSLLQEARILKRDA